MREIGYVERRRRVPRRQDFVTNIITAQSPDIAQGVDAVAVEGKDTAEQGAGDQGLMFGYACNETPELMPAPIMFAHRLGRALTRIRKSGKVGWLRPDAKSQVSVIYEDNKPVGIRTSSSPRSTPRAWTRRPSATSSWKMSSARNCPPQMLNDKTEFLINPTGRFVIGGPQGDTGLTGRKIIVDTYGGWGRHGGGAFSGKDPSKVDRSAAYMGRWVAKNVVAAGLATHCEVQFAYAIGWPDPVSCPRRHLRDHTVDEEKIQEADPARCSPSSRAGSSSNSTCFVPSTPRRPTTVTSARTTRTSPGKTPTRPRN